MARQSVEVDAPTRLPIPFGLFSVLNLAASATERWQNGIHWDALPCDADVTVQEYDCEDPWTPFPVDEDTSELLPIEGNAGECLTGEAEPFFVVGLYKAGLLARDITAAQDRAREVLEAHEERGAERHLWKQMWAEEDKVILDSGGDPLKAIGLAEKFIRDTYGSLGVIHVSAQGLYTLAKDVLVSAKGGQMQTVLGTPVVVGSGYPEAEDPDGVEYIGASPALVGYSEATPTFVDAVEPRTNDLFIVAQRRYIIGYDPCGVAFAPINLGA